jgi:hypothetical protein
MLLRLITLFALLLTLAIHDAKAEILYAKADTNWTTGGSVGLDMSQLALINPKIGAGENKLAFGGLTTLFAKYKAGKTMWNNEGSLQLAAQRLGGGDNPFTKNLDVLRFNSKFGYQITAKLNGAILANFESLLLPTYNDLSLTSNQENFIQARFLSPANIILAPGLDYLLDEYLSIFFGPIAYKSVLVLDDEIAALGVHGNPWTSSSDFQNVKHEMGVHLRAKYNKVYYEKLSVGSDLGLFYDYLADEHGAEFVDIIWINEVGYELFKGFSLNLLLDARWDRDVASVLPEGELPDGLKEFQKWMITEALVLKYSYILK